MTDAVSYDDAVQAMNHVAPYVNNADTKIGLLAAAMTVLTGGIIHQRGRFETLVNDQPGGRGWAAVVLLAVSAAALLVAGFWLFRALIFRIMQGRFAARRYAALERRRTRPPPLVRRRHQARRPRPSRRPQR